jgi:muramoyltetrapeptide carboxypeptidase
MLPPYLQPNDQIRILSPSGAIDPLYIDGATKMLNSWGLQVSEGEFARTAYGRFAATPLQRIADLQQALDDPEVKAILCSRGGYGLAQIIDSIDFSTFEKHPKWLIGYSDITILHNAITNLGIASIHGPMSKPLTELSADTEQLTHLNNILFGQLPHYTFPAEPLNRTGKAIGKMIGGNLSVFMGMRGTGYDLDYSNTILFIEDIAEDPYKIDRMIQNLRYGGVLAQLSGLVVGQFSDCTEDPLMMQTIAEIISTAVADYNYPVCFNFPAGHVVYNLPLLMGTNAVLEVRPDQVQLSF